MCEGVIRQVDVKTDDKGKESIGNQDNQARDTFVFLTHRRGGLTGEKARNINRMRTDQASCEQKPVLKMSKTIVAVQTSVSIKARGKTDQQ